MSRICCFYCKKYQKKDGLCAFHLLVQDRYGDPMFLEQELKYKKDKSRLRKFFRFKKNMTQTETKEEMTYILRMIEEQKDSLWYQVPMHLSYDDVVVNDAAINAYYERLDELLVKGI